MQWARYDNALHTLQFMTCKGAVTFRLIALSFSVNLKLTKNTSLQGICSCLVLNLRSVLFPMLP